MKRIQVLLTSHLIERINERVFEFDNDRATPLRSMNKYFRNGILAKDSHGDDAKIFFEGQSFALAVVHEGHRYLGITMKFMFRPKIKGEKVAIQYLEYNK